MPPWVGLNLFPADPLPTTPPASEAELLERARNIAGQCIGRLSARASEKTPNDLSRHKGWAGELIERLLGAQAGSRPEPDFPHLGIELKTIPVSADGRPRESTYVCVVPLMNEAPSSTWEDSLLRRKLQRVLWVPIEAEPATALAQRRVGSALIWSPSEDEEAALRADWEELMDMVCMGKLELISAYHGTWLQIRPKAANSNVRRWGIGESGEPIATVPRGFYLRPAFTEAILSRNYIIAG